MQRASGRTGTGAGRAAAVLLGMLSCFWMLPLRPWLHAGCPATGPGWWVGGSVWQTVIALGAGGSSVHHTARGPRDFIADSR